MVFDVKYDLRHKARLVAGGNLTVNDKEDIYSGVLMVCISRVYRCTVFIYFNLEFSGMENQGQGCYEGNVRSEVRFSEALLLL
jgi:hypothetical protein